MAHRFFCRWHIIFLFFIAFFAAFSAQGEALSADDIRALKLTPQGDTFFVGQEVTYTLVLAGVDPSLARAEIPDSLAGARFVSAKKEELYDVNGSGTRFVFQIAFLSAGKTALPPLSVYINRRAYAIPFEQVTVYEDPATILPRLSIVFDDERLQGASVSEPIGVTAGEPVGFTLYAQYCTQFLHFSWELPKNAIFTETERFAIARGEAQAKFSPDRIPVAHFVWTPLVAGAYTVPQFAIEAVAYNGTHTNPATPAYTLLVQAAAEKMHDEKSGRADQAETLFADAFLPVQAEPATAAQDDDAQSAVRSEPLAVMVSRHKSLPTGLLALSVASALAGGACVAFRRRGLSVVPFVLALVLLAASIWAKVQTARQYAIFAGGTVSLVPEDGSRAVTALPDGTRVRLVEKAGDWVYIVSDDGVGWVRAEAVQEIR